MRKYLFYNLKNPALRFICFLCIFSFSVEYILAVFVWSCAFLVIFVNSCVLPFVSVVTFLGGCLILIVTVSNVTEVVIILQVNVV